MIKVNLTWSQAMPLFIENIKRGNSVEAEKQLMSLARAYDNLNPVEKKETKVKKRHQKKAMPLTCPGCHRAVGPQGFKVHIRSRHPELYKTIDWSKYLNHYTVKHADGSIEMVPYEKKDEGPRVLYS